MTTISTGQMKMIYSLARKCRLDNDALHDVVKSVTGAESIKTLSTFEARKVIDKLMTFCGTSPKDAADRATKAQQRYIYQLARDMGWDDPSRLRGFLQSRFGASAPEWLRATSAAKAIEAMKSMKQGGRCDRRIAE